ncbi:universal stress protein [Synechocystis sp. B12]|nr:universal stress protein [Synechocystis sp. B12]
MSKSLGLAEKLLKFASIIAHCPKPWRVTLFNRILVALDLSPAGQEVLEKGLSLAKVYGASLLLLHVLSAEEEGSPLPIPVNMDEIYPAAGNELTMEVWQQQWQTFEQEGLDTLEKRRQQALALDIECQAEQILGSPGKIICQRAKQDNSDIIVVGHRGRWGLSEILLGSVGNYVFHHAHCCVFVVPTPD